MMKENIYKINKRIGYRIAFVMRAEHMELKLLSLWTMIPEKDLINIIECANNCEPIDQDKLDKISRELNVSKDFLKGNTNKIEPLEKPTDEEVEKVYTQVYKHYKNLNEYIRNLDEQKRTRFLKVLMAKDLDYIHMRKDLKLEDSFIE